MRLRSVWISEYKNLKDFTINFDGQSFIDIFVGKNGTGKSNFFEALIEIFEHMYQGPKRPMQEVFDFEITYEKDGAEIEIKWEGMKLSVNGKASRKVGSELLPENILLYYSGHNKKVTDLVQAYEESFQKRIRGASVTDSRWFIGIGKEYKQLLLAVLLLQEDDNMARQFICNKFGIESTTKDLELRLQRPFYARTNNSKYRIDVGDKSSSYWRVRGITKTFLEKLASCNSEGYDPEEGYERGKDEYQIRCDIPKIQEAFKDASPQELFRQFDNLKTLEMLQSITIPVILEDGTATTTDHFSDGQFQTAYIYSILELFRDRNCIALLDEPDSFLHPEWQFEFLKQVIEITDSAGEKNHILMSTHSPSTITLLEGAFVNFFKIDNSRIVNVKASKKEAIDSLSNGFIVYSEAQKSLSINNFLRGSTGPVLFVEGPSDVLILETALKKIYGGEGIPILIQDAFDRGFIKVLMSRAELFTNHPNRKFFALFDFDEAYEDWRELGGTNVETDVAKGLGKKLHGKDAHVFLLPVPDNALRTQVWDENNQIEKVKPNRCFGIEHLFWGLDQTNGYFKEHEVNGSKRIIFKGDKYKVKFAENIVPTLPAANFECLRALFESIRAKCA